MKGRLQAIWARLKPDLETFLAAHTKTEKLQWFVDHGFTESSILLYVTRISLPDGTRPLSKMNIPMAAALAPGSPVAIGSVPTDVSAFLQEFWNRWVSTRNFLGVTASYVASKELAFRLGAKGQPDDVAPSRWLSGG